MNSVVICMGQSNLLVSRVDISINLKDRYLFWILVRLFQCMSEATDYC